MTVRRGRRCDGAWDVLGAGFGKAPEPAPVSGGAAPTASPAPTVAAIKRGGVYHSILDDPPHFDIHQTTTSILHSGHAIPLSKLVEYKTGKDVPQPSLIPVGDVADSWTQPDDLTYIFKLRPGIKFHNLAPVNGRELVAQDVAFSFERQIAQKVNADLLSSVSKIEATDKSMLRITLKAPDADFLVSLASGPCRIVAHEQVEARGDLKEWPIIGTGPWISAEARKGSAYSYKRNPDYFIKGVPYVDEIQYLVIPDAAARQAALRSKNIENYRISSDQTAVDTLVKAEPSFKVVRIPNLSSAEIGIKADRGAGQDIRVRQAISKVINRQQIIDTVYGGAGWFSPGIALPSADWGIPENDLKQMYKPDTEGARKLMLDAGMSGGLEIKARVTDTSGGLYATVAELVRAQLEPIGVRVTLEVMPHANWADVVTRGDFDMFIGTNGSLVSTTANSDLFARHHSKGSRNVTGLKDPELDAKIEKQATLVKDPEGRKKLLLEIQRTIIDKAYLLMIGATVSDFVSWPYVKDFYPGIAGNVVDFQSYLWLDR
jgi:peptide/nickel transport system substrate-binding protein